MNTVEGYAMSSWERGYGDFVLQPDPTTLRLTPWLPGTALCMADVTWGDGTPVPPSPRQILRRQLDRLAERGWKAAAGTELEFIVFRDTYEQAWHKSTAELEPANLYNVDYSLLGTARVEPLIRRIRNDMAAAGMRVEDSKGECNFGQHEVNFRYADALTAADTHVVYKNGAQGDRQPGGHGHHLHGQVRRARGQLVPHPLLLRRATTASRCSPRTRACSTASSPGSSRAWRR
jgi:glutamine synthetase